MIDTISICWHVKSPKNSRKKSSATLAISLKHGAIVPALSFNEFLNPSAEVGVGGKFVFLHSPIAHCSFTKGWIMDSIVTWLSYICLRGVQVVPAMFLISLSTFLFLTSDISGSCWFSIFKWKWLSWMKAVPLQPSRHRWHLSLVFRKSALFFV